jgi:hypothetical protein
VHDLVTGRISAAVLGPNVPTATQAGMAGVLHSDLDSTVEATEALLCLSLA